MGGRVKGCLGSLWWGGDRSSESHSAQGPISIALPVLRPYGGSGNAAEESRCTLTGRFLTGADPRQPMCTALPEEGWGRLEHPRPLAAFNQAKKTQTSLTWAFLTCPRLMRRMARLGQSI